MLPTESPVKKVTIMLMTGALLPTAAIASDEEKLPTIAVSDALNSCCKVLIRKIGIVMYSSFLKMPPWSISTALLLLSLIIKI